MAGSIQGLCPSQRMDNNASNETSEASVIRNREDVQDIFLIEGENGALGTVQNKQESP